MSPVAQYLMGWNLPAIICLVVGLALMVFEMFTPGMGAPGILGALSLIAAIILRADSVMTALVTLLLILIPLIIAATLIFRSFAKGAISRSPIVLKDSISGESTPLGEAEAQALVGSTGTATSALRPAGTADFDGRRLDVVSDGDFIPKDAAIKIVRVEGLRITVKRA